MDSLHNGADTLFVLLGAVMVLAMHSGLAFLEVGTVRHKNQVNALVAVNSLMALVGGFTVHAVLKALVGLRLDAEHEFEGAGLSMHRISASPRD